CQNCQEIFDTIIAAYRLAEDPEVLVPVLVSYDGWYISYLIERVEVATQESVNRFLSPVAQVGRLKYVPGYVGEPTWVHGYIEPSNRVVAQGPANRNELRLKHELATDRAKDKLEEIAEEFEEIFGRPLVGQIEEYKTDDAEILLVAMGSEAMTARVVVDKKRNEGIKVGLVRIKMFRPCPKKKLTKVFAGKKSIGVLEQGICHGWNTGFLLLDIKAILYDAKVNIPVPNFLTGMSGDDITTEQIEQAIDITYKASRGEDYREVTWLSMPYLYE
ncbi:pyruvate synthase subunit PorA, partial [Chloroflexota bacterium]